MARVKKLLMNVIECNLTVLHTFPLFHANTCICVIEDL